MDEWHFNTHRLGRRVLVFESLESTNAYALDLAGADGNDGLVVLARQQTAGRGQYGRSWLAPPDSSVLLSLLLYPPAALRRPALLTAFAAVSVAEVVLVLTGQQARIKWPNDVLLNGKKICGILIEQRSFGNEQATVIGIGLNVRQPASFFEQAELPLGGSLLSTTGTSLETDTAARALIQELDEGYDRLLRGNLQILESRWQQRLGLLGTMVEAETAEGLCFGRLERMNLDEIEITSKSRLRRLVPERVRHLRAVNHGNHTWDSG